MDLDGTHYQSLSNDTTPPTTTPASATVSVTEDGSNNNHHHHHIDRGGGGGGAEEPQQHAREEEKEKEALRLAVSPTPSSQHSAARSRSKSEAAVTETAHHSETTSQPQRPRSRSSSTMDQLVRLQQPANDNDNGGDFRSTVRFGWFSGYDFVMGDRVYTTDDEDDNDDEDGYGDDGFDDDDDDDVTTAASEDGRPGPVRLRPRPRLSREELLANGGAAGADSMEETLLDPSSLSGASAYFRDMRARGRERARRRRRRRHGDANAGLLRSFVAIFKSFVGSGVLFLPEAFYRGGILFSPVVFVVLSAVALYNIVRLIECWQQEKAAYGEIGKRAFGVWGRVAVDTSLVLTQSGVCCVYLIFVADNLRKVMEDAWDVPVTYLILIQLPLLIPLTWIRRLWKLGYTNLFAASFVIFCLTYIYYYDIYSLATNGHAPVKLVNVNQMALFVGTSTYVFHGVATMVPVQESMAKPHLFRPLLMWTMGAIMSLFISFGVLGYAAFGDKVGSPVTENLPDEPIADVVLILYSVALFFAFPLILFPVVRILEDVVFRNNLPANDLKRKWLKNGFRGLIVLVLGGVALGGANDFSSFVAVIGGAACTPLAFIYPSLFHLKMVAKTRLAKAIDMTICIGGVLCMILSTTMAIFFWGSTGT